MHNNFLRNKEGQNHNIQEDFIKKLIRHKEKHFNQKNKIKMLFNLIYKVFVIIIYFYFFRLRNFLNI